MAQAEIPLPQQQRFAETSRTDKWWLQSLLTFLGLSSFIVYSTFRAFQGDFFETGSLLSPFYSPLVFGDSDHAWFTTETFRWFPLSPALLVLWAPGGFRFTCYYYRGAYYKAFWADPVACSVGEPRKKYLGENTLPLIMQNLHRYMLYLAIPFIGILFFDFVKACFWMQEDGARQFGIHVGTLVLLLNVILLGSYTFGCHSLRHLIGGGLDIISRRPMRKKALGCVNCLNKRHMIFAWCSLFWVGFTDLYVFLCAKGIWIDYGIIGA